jgi:hypothetical protein
MNAEKNELDTFQLHEEVDPEWVNLWDDCKTKKEPGTKQLTFDVVSK